MNERRWKRRKRLSKVITIIFTAKTFVIAGICGI